MNTALKQLVQWPPTTSTVIGIGLIGAAVDYLLTGSMAQAMFVAGVLKILIPEDAAAAGTLQQILSNVPGAKTGAAMLFAGALGVAGLGGLAACSNVSGVSGLAATPIGQSLITALVTNLAPGINQSIANASAGIASSKDAAIAAYALPWAKQALDFFGVAAGLSTTTIAELDSAIVTAESLLANPPANLSAAIADAAGVYQQVVSALAPALKS